MLAFTLAACGSYEDASAEAEADTVEIPANQALEGVSAQPVADPDADTNIVGDDVILEEDTATAENGEAPPAADPAEAVDVAEENE